MVSISRGFTLAELLIALGILGIIATFTIPKIINNQQSTKDKAITKEAATIASQAYLQYKMTNTPTSSTAWGNLVSNINYVKVVYDNVALIDDVQGSGSITCSMFFPCYKLHSGAVLMTPATPFGGTGPTDHIGFWVDPDGVYSGNSTGPGKSIYFRLYFNGRLDDDTSSPSPWFNWD